MVVHVKICVGICSRWLWIEVFRCGWACDAGLGDVRWCKEYGGGEEDFVRQY